MVWQQKRATATLTLRSPELLSPMVAGGHFIKLELLT